jgi:hypothetical protein
VIITRRRGGHLPSGLFCYWRERHLATAPALRAEHFIAIDMLNPAVVLTALLTEL